MAATILTELITAGVRSSAELDGLWHRAMLDEAFVGNHNALLKLQSPRSGRKAVSEIWDNGSALMSSATENSDGSVTDFAPATIEVTCAPFQLIRSTSDGARMTDVSGALTAESLVQDGVTSYGRTLMSLIAAVVSGTWSATKGSSGTQLTMDDVLDAEAALSGGGVTGRLLCVLNPLQFAPIRKELLSNGGGTLVNSLEGQVLASPMQAVGYQGTLGRIDFFTTPRVTVSSGDYQGALLGEKSIAWADMDVTSDPGTYSLIVGGKLKTEWNRRGARLMTEVQHSAWLGAAKAFGGRGVRLTGSA